MRLICLDTNILTWGLKKECTPGQEENLEKAESLIERLFQLGDHIVIPTLVLSELLVTIPEEKHNEFLSDIAKNDLVRTSQKKLRALSGVEVRFSAWTRVS
jgi:hypothetical protein